MRHRKVCYAKCCDYGFAWILIEFDLLDQDPGDQKWQQKSFGKKQEDFSIFRAHDVGIEA